MLTERLLKILFVLGALVSLPACAGPLTYSAEPIEAWVVDAKTKQPLEGVVVTANWQLEEGTLGGSVPAGQLMVLESVTDKNGRFFFPAWGPKRVPKGHLVNDDPQLLLFMSGYEYQRLNNPYSSNRELRLRPVRRSVWSGRTIELKKFVGTPKQRLEMLERSIPSLGRREDYKRSILLKAILAEEGSIPDSVEGKRLFFDNIVRRLLEGR
ncbi:MAG: peptidase associated/transthyretin-like domain-containing protein [Sulfuricaulis sp.]